MIPFSPVADVGAELFRQIADHAPQVMVTVSIPGLLIVYANIAAHRIVGMDQGRLVGRHVGDSFPFFDLGMLEACAASGLLQAAAVDGRGTGWWDVSFVPLISAATAERMVLVTAVDVTRHERARAAAQAAGDTLNALLAYVPEGITISHGPDVHVAYVSAKGVALTRRPKADLIGQSALRHAGVWDVVEPDGGGSVAPEDRPLARATRTGEVRMNETLLIHRPDGSILPVLCNSGPIRDASGRVTGAVMTWHDISALQRTQSALRHSEERLRAVLLQIPAAIFLIEVPDGRVTFKSQLVDEVLGHPDPDLESARTGLQGWAVHPDGRPYELDEYPSRRALFRGETVRAEPMTYYRGDRTLIDLEIYAGPVRNPEGEVVAAVVAALDVTQRKLAAERLRDSEARLRVAVEAGGLGTWEIDPAANRNHLGASLAALLGLPAEPVVFDRSVSATFIHSDDRERVAEEFARAMAETDDFVSEFRVLRTDGTARWVTSHGRIIRAPDGSPTRAVGVMRDVTERRAREDKLREAAEARELLVREADHRIKNSLQLVGSLLGLQRGRLSDPDAVAALDGAITRVMAVSEAHRALHQSTDLRHVALDDMLRDLCVHVGTLNPAVTFLCDCPAELELDTERAIPLGLVVSELLTNAAKHAYPGAAGEVRTTASVAEGSFDIVVADAGVGMAAAAPSRARLGSTIVRALVAQIGAEIDVESAPGEGTRTRVRFPQRA